MTRSFHRCNLACVVVLGEESTRCAPRYLLRHSFIPLQSFVLYPVLAVSVPTAGVCSFPFYNVRQSSRRPRLPQRRFRRYIHSRPAAF